VTFDAKETSANDGQPVEIYEFKRALDYYRYTSSFDDVTFDGRLYDAVTIKRSATNQTNEFSKTGLVVTARRDLVVGELFRITPPSDVVMLTVKRLHETDTDEEAAVVWIGRVLNAEWRRGEVVFSCEPVQTSLKRNGLRRRYQRSCPHTLYETPCGVSRSAHQLNATVGSISGLTLTVPGVEANGDGYYSGGYIEWDEGAGIKHKRFIPEQTGQILTLSIKIPNITPGESVKVFPGCPHVLAICNSRYGNKLNYGGMPWKPTKNPFGSDPVY